MAGPTPENTIPNWTVDQCRASSDANADWGLAVSHRFYCQSVDNFVINHFTCMSDLCRPPYPPCTTPSGICQLNGSDTFSLTTIGRINYDSQRKIQFDLYVDNWRHQGQSYDSQVMRLEMLCRQGACGLQPGGSHEMTIAAWKNTPVVRAEFSPPQGQMGTGADNLTYYKFNGKMTMVSGDFPDQPTFALNEFRCDDATYVAVATGCVFHQVTEIFTLRRSDPTTQETAQHVWDALNRPNSTIPRAISKTIPGKVGSQLPLERIPNTDPRYEANRTQAKRTCRQYYNVKNQRYTQDVPNGPVVDDCDEYPFASTKQGAANAGLDYSVRAINSTDNQRAGNALLNVAFYQGMRVIGGDKFYVDVVGEPSGTIRIKPIRWNNCQIFNTFPVCNEMLDTYLRLGGPNAVGYPTGEFETTPDESGNFQHYSRANSIYWSPDTGAHQIGGNIRNAWAAQGWEQGPLGFPTTDELTTLDGAGKYNHFLKPGQRAASIYWTQSLGAHSVQGEIRDKWAALGWERGLGYPTTDETATPDGVGRYNHFSNNASVYWTPESQAKAIRGHIRDKWAALGWERGLGYPTTDESTTPDGVGRYNHFSKLGSPLTDASVYWTPASGANSVRGSFLYKWATLGYERGHGYPVEEEQEIVTRSPGGVLLGTDYFQGFRALGAPGPTASLTRWTSPSASGGPFEIHGANYLAVTQAYGPEAVAELSTDELTTPDGVGRYNNFEIRGYERGAAVGEIFSSAIWNPRYGARIVKYAIWQTWRDHGFERGWLGYPTSDEYGSPAVIIDNTPYVKQDFEGGCVHRTRLPGGTWVTGASAHSSPNCGNRP